MVLGGDSLPALVAMLSDEDAFDRLEGVARKGGVTYVSVKPPPSSRALHSLVVRAPNRRHLTLLAEVLGPLTDRGAPLRLRFPQEQHAKSTVQYAEAPSAGVTDPLVGRTLAAGKLTIETCVGVGGAGTVYRAMHRDLQMWVAVKVMHDNLQRDAKYCQRFHSEALSASRLDHANLTRVYDFGQEPDGLLYIAMEFLDGLSLREVLERDGAMPFDRAAAIMAMVCSGLTHAHARSIVHRDIKPENVVLVRGLDDDGKETEIAKVCDFGIAHRASDGQATFAGTPEYISPEQLMGEEPGVQSDVYACGVVLYELLTGVVPIEGDITAVAKRMQDPTPPPPPSRRRPGIDPRIDRLVMKAIARDREIRHASVRELRTEIRSLAEDIAVFSTGGYWDAQGVSSVHPAPVAPNIRDAAPNDWLEHGNGHLSSLMPSAPPSSRSMSAAPARASIPAPASHPPLSTRPKLPSLPDGMAGSSIVPGSHVSMTPSMTPEAVETTKNVATFVRRLVETHDSEKFGAFVAPLEPKVRALFEGGHIAPAWRLCSALDMIAREKTARSEHAMRALVTFADRQILAKLAEKSLDFLEDKEGVARKLVVRAGNRGAYALYGARLKHTAYEARERFVAMMIDIGTAGAPTIKAGLERLEAKLGVPGALSMVEDLLRAIPDVADEELGQLVARYVKSNVNSVALLATQALPKAWGMRARPLLLLQIHHKNDDVATAAIKKLRALGGVDSELLEQLRPIVMGAPGSRPTIRHASVEACESVTADARDRARQLLVAALDVTQGATPDVEDMVVLLSNTIVAIDGDATAIALRCRQSTPHLRARLEAVLKRARLPGH